jgi:hypothetical protein
MMNASTLYRIASVLLVLFAAGHTFGFLKFKAPTAEGVAVREAMAKVVFSVGGRTFSYERFYVGFGLFITVSLLFSAFLSWHLSALASRNPEAIGALGWVFFVVQIASLVLSWLFFFPITAVFSGLVALCLGWAAWLVK